MFKWEPIEKLYATPDEISRKIGRVLLGFKEEGRDVVLLSRYSNGHWDFMSEGPKYFMLIEPLPTE